MYLPIGSSMAVRERSIVGIFDLDNTTCSKHTRAFLREAEQNGQVVTAGEELPKSFLLTQEYGLDRVYLVQLSAQTMEKRTRKEAALCQTL
ncbi:MAG: DUF370 domain-containing protein [Oscillospiraceae bacterium]|nr:DUF370 domain-containing protein [Oscillospiraceae bacterium]